ncbi:MAG TPA: hypothetical protein VLJ57_04750 [Burkholderiaceae bacterium]|nr:hypothetical protein [Burkholderiaceae bacterium]
MVTQPSPAIVAQSAVRRLPRLALLLLCAAYVLAGFIGREPWKSADMTAFGYMLELARGTGIAASDWLQPKLLGLPPEVDALLPYWLGAWAIQATSGWLVPDLAARFPFVVLLALTLMASWYGVYYLARSPQAQPVAFAFGGEALPADYARAMADGGLLALLACLGLAQLSHETTPALAQLCFTALFFFAVAAAPYRTLWPAVCAVLGLAGLTLSGAPTMAMLLGAGGAAISFLEREDAAEAADTTAKPPANKKRWAIGLALLTMLLAGMATALDLWHWRISLPQEQGRTWRSIGRLLLWFIWPVWPLALWTLWRWRRQLSNGNPGRHLALPVWFAAVSVGTTLVTSASDRSLLLALPALAALAAFALPTFQRSAAALIDWFTLLFFTGCAIVIWVIWIAMQTGFPKKPAANVVKLAPGFEPSFSLVPFVIALAATLVWAWVVYWRTGRNRAAIWKTLVLPAGGAALCWLLLMTLWMPLLDFARSYTSVVYRVVSIAGRPSCIEFHGLNRGQIAAFQYHGKLALRHAEKMPACPWLLVDADAQQSLPNAVDMQLWTLRGAFRRPADHSDDVLLYTRIPQ